ncbi:MAG TPA: HlyD family secretion protein, partial [Chitinophagaceae bacterium]|nr:HlyD family secretion protein [Chitinophagaceae bacterium]
MNRYLSTFIAVGLLSLTACNSDKNEFDATGVFEADEVIVAAENAGRILQFDAKEGDSLAKDQVTVLIDPVGLELQKAQVDASMQALQEKTI